MIQLIGKELYQWDTGRQVKVADGVTEVHFGCCLEKGTLNVAVKDGVADIPNLLLQRPIDIMVYGVVCSENCAHTVQKVTLNVSPRQKPADYVYTETEVKTYESLEKRIETLENNGVSEEKIEGVVKNYLEENPIETGATEEQAAQIEKNKNDITGLSERAEKNKSDIAELSDAIDDLKENGVSRVEPTEDDIPKVFFSEAIPQDKNYVKTKFRYISKTLDVSGYAEFKAQGNSSMNFPKKNQTVKLYKDENLNEKLKINFKDWGEQSKFVLKANWIDITHSRNVVGSRLWTQICETRRNSLPQLLQEAPKLGSIDGFPIKLYSGGIYQGRYSWNIPKDKWTFNMDDELENHVVLCGETNDANTPSVFATSSDNIDGTYWTDEIHEDVPSSVITAWNRVLAFVNESTDEEFKNNVADYIDIDSVIDYLIFNVYFGNTDAYGKNHLWITYDLTNWLVSAYDLDQFCGLNWQGSLAYESNSTHPITVAKYNNLILKTVRNFSNEIKERCAYLRETVLSLDNVINEFERWTDICPKDLVEEDYATTTANGAFTGIPTKADTNNIQQIRDWVVKRFDICDSMKPEFGIIDKTDVNWVHGAIVPPAGTIDYGKTARLVTENYIDDNVSKVVAKDGYKIIVFCYDKNGDPVNGGDSYWHVQSGSFSYAEWLQSADLEAAKELGVSTTGDTIRFRIMMKRDDDAYINVSESANITLS